MIYYLAHPYSNDPLKSFKNAQRWTYILRRVGFYPFSPILHTHPYYDTMTDNFGFNGVPVGTVEEFTNYMNTENFVDWDLKIIEGFMNHDGYIGATLSCKICNKTYKLDDNSQAIPDCDCKIGGHIVDKIYYDSGIILLLSNTAYFVDSKDMDDIYKRDLHPSVLQKTVWKSDGCRLEYNFAKSHHIRVLELESFLEGKEVDL